MKNHSFQKKITVLGLGYIGLPTASMFATHGHRVIGVDINESILARLKRGEIHIEEPGLATVVKAAFASKNLSVKSAPETSDVFIIAVPTPAEKTRNGNAKADMSYVKSAATSILPRLKKGNLVILESTSPPGTTMDLIVPMIKKRGFRLGEDIGVAYCPERVIPGKALKELTENDRVVGAVTPAWAKTTADLYRSFVSGKIFLTDPTTAELVKLVENTFRDVNIALANEVARICEKNGVDVWEVLQLANRHPRVNVHRPGPGVGGHCISVDPWFIAEKFPADSKLVQLARHINDAVPAHVVGRVQKLMAKVKQPKIVILGVAYKGNVDDIRESPALHIIAGLKKKFKRINIVVYDPHVRTKDFPAIGIKEAFSAADLALLLTPHDEYQFLDPQEIQKLMNRPLIYDTHNFLDPLKWKPAGFQLVRLGDSKNSDQPKANS